MAPVAPLVVVPIPGVALRVHGDAAAARHLAMEYAPAGGEPSTASEVVAALDVHFVSKLPDARAEGHKTIRWSATLERTAPQHLQLRIALRGWPRWFGLSLVQGYLIEPALSLLAVEAGGVLLPAAAIVQDGAALLLIGRSGTGKSSVSMRAFAAGLPLLGDDQVFVSGDGTCTRFPRRLRIYDDAARTAPGAISRLPVRDRVGLLVRRVVRVATRGYVAPSLAIPLRALGGADAPTSVPLGRVALLSRVGEGRPACGSTPQTLPRRWAIGRRAARSTSSAGPRARRALGGGDQRGGVSRADPAGARVRVDPDQRHRCADRCGRSPSHRCARPRAGSAVGAVSP